MAELLGTKYCIESLFQDITDIQDTVAEVSSRVGQVNYQSWKFPDKSSSDVDIAELLGDYKYDEDDDEQNQISHVMLYDLLIDRLLFLLQCFTYFNEVLLDSKLDRTKTNGKSSVKSLSAGLTVKRCWSRLSQVAVAMQQLGRIVQKSTDKNDIVTNRLTTLRQSSTQVFMKTASNFGDVTTPISRDLLNRSCQTDETTYVSCELCCRTQACLYDVGKCVAKVCKSQGLPTSLEDYISRQSDSNLLSVAELTRWKNLQMKDLSRIERQIESLMKQINPLKSNLATAAKKETEYKAMLDQADAISKRKLQEIRDQFLTREYKYKENERTTQGKLMMLTKENANLKEHLETLNVEISDVKNELLDKHRSLRATESEKNRLKEEALEGRQYEQDALRLQSEVAEMYRKLQSSEEKLQTTSTLLEKEQHRNRTMQSHEQALQEKQHGLLERLDELSEECEELREKVSIVEEEKEKIEEEWEEERRKQRTSKNETHNVTLLEDEKSTMQGRIHDLEDSIRNLEDQVEKHIEQERLLVSYPDLHKSHGLQVIENSGDVYTDMQRQVEANQIRITVLEEENVNLRRTLSRLDSKQPLSSTPSPRQQENLYHPPSVQLWKPQDSNDVDLTFLGLDDSSYHSLSTQPSRSNFHDKTPLAMRNKKHRSPKEAGKKTKEEQISPSRSSFSVGPGKRRAPTPSSSRPSSGRSALLKPWT